MGVSNKSYWEIQREYVIPTDVLNQGGTNEICVRLYNNNSDGGFYTNGNIYAICGNDKIDGAYAERRLNADEAA